MARTTKSELSAEIARDENTSIITQFNKIVKDIAAKIERPKARGTTSQSGGGEYSLDRVKEVRKRGDANQAREISRFFYNTNTSYARIIDHMANFFKYYYTLDLKGLSNGRAVNSKRALKVYNETLALLDNLNIEQTFEEISKRVLIDGAYFGYVNKFGEDQISLTMLDPAYCRTVYRSAYNTDVVQFDMSFFRKYNDAKDLNDALKRFPPEIKKGWRIFQSDSNARWVNFPPELACAFSFDPITGNNFPRLFDSIIDILNFEEYKDIEKKRDARELSKLLVQRFKLDDQNNLQVLLEEMAGMHEAASHVLEDREDIDLITTLADEVKMVDAKDSSVKNDNIQKMVMPKYEGSGLSYELFGSTTATALERNLMNTTSFMSQLIVKYSNWLSMFCYATFEYRDMRPVVTILPLTWYNENKLMDLYLKGAQYGYSWMLPYIATGKKQSTLLDSSVLEQDILQLKSKMIPLSSSFTSSTKEGEHSSKGEKASPGGKTSPGGKGGRPELPMDQKSEKTIKNIESM